MAIRKFAVIIDNEVAFRMDFDDEIQSGAVQRIIPAFLSNPEFIETEVEEVAFGWTWDGNEFHPPVF